MSPPTTIGDPTVPAPVPVPAGRTTTSVPTRRRTLSDVAYLVYSVALIGGFYGYVSLKTASAVTVPLSAGTVRLVGVVAAAAPIGAALIGARAGRWAGVVPIGRAEADILLPTRVDRGQLLLPRFRIATILGLVAGLVIGVAATLLLAFQGNVNVGAWLLAAGVGASSVAIGIGVAGAMQVEPLGAAVHAWLAACLGVAGVTIVGLLTSSLGHQAATNLGAGLVGTGSFTLAAGVVAATSLVAVAALRRAQRRLPLAHDEEFVARAGLHVGIAASAQLVDARAIKLTGDPTQRTTGGRSVAVRLGRHNPMLWRHLTVLWPRPQAVARIAVSWATATALLAILPQQIRPSDAIIRALLIMTTLQFGLGPAVEPLRREFDAPLAAELLPFTRPQLVWMHGKAAVLIATTIGWIAVALTLFATGRPEKLVLALVVVPLAALGTVVSVANQVRQRLTLPELMETMPVGLGPEVLSGFVVSQLFRSLTPNLPVGLAPLLGLLAASNAQHVAGPTIVGALMGLLLIASTTIGLFIWLSEYERHLDDGDLLDPIGTRTILRRRWQARRTERHANATPLAGPVE